MSRRRPLAAVLGVALTTSLLLLAPPASGAARVAEPYDFDGDGFPELVVGAPGPQVGPVQDAGGFAVLPGSTKGSSTKGRTITQATSGNKTYDQNTTQVPGTAEAEDAFGAAVTLLDHDADGHLDLTVGSPGENDGTGAITTLDGSGSSFTTKGSTTFGPHTLAYPTPGDAVFGLGLGAQRRRSTSASPSARPER